MSLGLLARYGLTRAGGGGGGDSQFLEATPTATFEGGAGNNFQKGWQFDANANITFTGWRFLTTATTASMTCRLWRTSDSSLLASAAANAVSDEWVTVTAASPIALVSGTRYIITVRSTDGTSFRGAANAPAAGFTFASAVSYVQGYIQGSDAYPTINDPGNLWGWVDGLYTDP